MEKINENEILNAFVDGARENENTKNKATNVMSFSELSDKIKECANLLGDYILNAPPLSSQKTNQLLRLRRQMLNFRAEN